MSLTLLDWRRQIADLYRDVRSQTAGDPAATLARFREGRRRLFATHPDSPIDDDRPPPEYWPWRRELRFEVVVDTTTTPVGGTTVEDSAGESAPFRRFGTVHLPVGDLDVYWLTSYGGGVFLPFRDATNGRSSYGGGRYLLDTVKGADLGGGRGTLVVDFNYAYHPSCFYSDRWACPLAPPGNRLPGPIEAGERLPLD